MSALGEEFRNAREARSLSLSDVAERLHIRSVYLAAIEDEDWPVIGAPVYVRGFMRTYARFLGLDPEAVVARFAAIGPPDVPPSAARPTPAGSAETIAGERSGPSAAGILAVVIAVAALLFVGYEFYQYRAGPPVAGPSAPAAAAAPATPAALAAPSAPANVTVVAAEGTVAAKAIPAAKRGLSLRVTETSWLRVTIDGNVALEGTLAAGTAKSFTGRSADVRVGNAAGVSIAVNGRPVGPLGGPGDVVERRFELSGE